MSAAHVLRDSDLLQVSGVYAVAHTAEVVEHKTLSDGPVDCLVNNPVRLTCKPVFATDAVAIGVTDPSPKPAGVALGYRDVLQSAR